MALSFLTFSLLITQAKQVLDNPKTFTGFNLRQSLAGKYVRILLSFDLLKVKQQLNNI